MVELVRCEHCGAACKYPVTKVIAGRPLNFCCAGCLSVYELLREEGVYPDQSGGGVAAPSQAEPAGTVERQTGGTAPASTITLTVVGMTCANCVATVGRSLRAVPGVLAADVDLAAGRAQVNLLPGVVTIADLRRAVKDAGYEVLDAGNPEAEPVDHKHARQGENRGPLSRLASMTSRNRTP